MSTNQDCLFLATNRDNHYPVKGKLVPGTGCWVDAMETASKRKAFTVAKPSQFLMDLICKEHNLKQDETIFFGDNLLTDIKFANNGGTSSVLVETGVHLESDIKKDSADQGTPEWVLSDIGQLVDPISQTLKMSSTGV
eukprot:Platyproteum_vivax@DN2016_c0_g1_i1.p2